MQTRTSTSFFFILAYIMSLRFLPNVINKTWELYTSIRDRPPIYSILGYKGQGLGKFPYET